jgi:hypothetical protein
VHDGLNKVTVPQHQHFKGTHVYGSASLTVVPDVTVSSFAILNMLCTRKKPVMASEGGGE